MALRLLRFFSLVLVALTLGLAFAHVLEVPGKLRLAGPDWLTVQQNLFALGFAALLIAVLAETGHPLDRPDRGQ